MASSIYATFSTEADAERAAGALMDHGIAANDISYIVPEASSTLPAAGSPGPTITHPYSEAAAYSGTDPAVRLPEPSELPAITVPVPSAPQTSADPPVGYQYDALGALIPDPAPRTVTVTTVTDPVTGSSVSRQTETISTGTVAAMLPDTAEIVGRAPVPGNATEDSIQAENRPHIVDLHRIQPAAAGGISTTTGADAAKGALGGAGIGLGLGALLGLAALAIPGVGLVAGAGALVAGLAAATGAAGGLAGGVFGYLADLGLPADHVKLLSEQWKTGGVILSVQDNGVLGEQELLQVLRKYGATSAVAY